MTKVERTRKDAAYPDEAEPVTICVRHAPGMTVTVHTEECVIVKQAPPSRTRSLPFGDLSREPELCGHCNSEIERCGGGEKVHYKSALDHGPEKADPDQIVFVAHTERERAGSTNYHLTANCRKLGRTQGWGADQAGDLYKPTCCQDCLHRYPDGNPPESERWRQDADGAGTEGDR
jgi:hypothetical protein